MTISRSAISKQVTKVPSKKPKKADDACTRKVKARYKVWPSAYASGALAKCRKVGAKNWGNSTKSSKKSSSKKAKSY